MLRAIVAMIVGCAMASGFVYAYVLSRLSYESMTAAAYIGIVILVALSWTVVGFRPSTRPYAFAVSAAGVLSGLFPGQMASAAPVYVILMAGLISTQIVARVRPSRP